MYFCALAVRNRPRSRIIKERRFIIVVDSKIKKLNSSNYNM
jgi:hypothetical protein